MGAFASVESTRVKTRVSSIIVRVARRFASTWGKKTPFERERELRRRAEDDERLYKEQVRISETLNRIGLDLSAELDLGKLVQHLTDEATALSGAQFGAFFYNLVDAAGQSFRLYALSGVPREAFAGFPLPRNTELFGPTFRGETVEWHRSQFPRDGLILWWKPIICHQSY